MIKKPVFPDAIRKEIFQKKRLADLRGNPDLDDIALRTDEFSFRTLGLLFGSDLSIAPITTEDDIIYLAKGLIEWPGVTEFLSQHDWRTDFALGGEELKQLETVVTYLARDFPREGHHFINLNIAIVLARAITSNRIDANDEAALFDYVEERLAKKFEPRTRDGYRESRLSELLILYEDMMRFDHHRVEKLQSIAGMSNRDHRRRELEPGKAPSIDLDFQHRQTYKYGFANRKRSGVAALTASINGCIEDYASFEKALVFRSLQERLRRYPHLKKTLINDLSVEKGK